MDTNIVYIVVDPTVLKRKKIDHMHIYERLLEEQKCQTMVGFYNENMRFVTHRDIDRNDCEKIV